MTTKDQQDALNDLARDAQEVLENVALIPDALQTGAEGRFNARVYAGDVARRVDQMVVAARVLLESLS